MSLKKVNNRLEFEGQPGKRAVNMSVSLCFYVHIHCVVAATAVLLRFMNRHCYLLEEYVSL